MLEIQTKFPELTAVLTIGGTRTAYALHTGQANIEDFQTFVQWNFGEYQRIIRDYQELGGRHLIMPALAWQTFGGRGEKYTQGVIAGVRILISPAMLDFYQELNFRVRFVGLDTLLWLPDTSPEYRLGLELQAFNDSWQTGTNYLVWEIAPIPPFSILQSGANIPKTGSLKDLHNSLYRQLANYAYGLEMPIPHFYVGTARNGDLKMRSMLPFALASGTQTRLYYLPYPSIMMSREALQAIMEDFLAGVKDRAHEQYDYEDILSPELIAEKRQQFAEKIADTSQIIGMARR